MPNDVYEQLCRSYEFMLGPIPNRQEFKAAIVQALTEEEVRVVLLCPLAGEISYAAFEKRAARAGIPADRLETIVRKLVPEGFLASYVQPEGRAGRAYPSAAPLFDLHQGGRVVGRGDVVSMCEMQVRKDVDDPMRRASAAWMNAMIEGGAITLPTKTPYYRAIPVEPTVRDDPGYGELQVDAEIPDPRQVMPFDIVSEMVRKEPVIALAECYCRRTKQIAGEGCDHPMETCIYFNDLALLQLEAGRSRRIDADEAIEILRRSAEAGLVHNISNCEGEIGCICNCCSCSCGIMKAHQRGLRNAGAVSRFIVAHDGQRCTACGVCVDICPMDVFAMDDGSVTLDRARCIGCGLCVMNCPESAVHMAVREDAPRIPRNGKALMRRITFEAIVSKAKDALFGGRRG